MGSLVSVPVVTVHESLDEREARVRAAYLAEKEEEERKDHEAVVKRGNEFIRSFSAKFDRQLETCIAVKKDPRSCKFFIWNWTVGSDAIFPEEDLHMYSTERTTQWIDMIRAVDDTPTATYRVRLLERLAEIVPGEYSVNGQAVVLRLPGR